MTEVNKLLIEPAAGFSPQIGILVSTMTRCREKTIVLVQDLTIYQLDYLWDAEANTIGALLLHIASIEAAYQENTFYGRNILDNPERIKKWRVPMYLGEPARETIRGNPIGYYLDELQAMREKTLAQLRQYDDDWLWIESKQNQSIANNYWKWFHVYEDEINHRGEISWFKSRIPALAPK